MTDKLKSCPFCGGEADTEWRHGYWGVRCESCYAEVTADGMSDALAAWNNRKPMDRIVKQLENASCYIEDDDGHAGHLVFTDEAIAIVKGVQNE